MTRKQLGPYRGTKQTFNNRVKKFVKNAIVPPTMKNLGYVVDKVLNMPARPGTYNRPKHHKSTPNPMSRRKGLTGRSVAVYKGNFKKTKRIKRTIEQTCLSKGSHRTLEQYGTFSDPDTVYLHHSISHVDEIARTMNAGLIRKILNKAGFQITNLYNEIAVSNPVAGLDQPENSSGLKFVLCCRDPLTGHCTNYTYDTVNNQSFKSIVETWTDMHYRIIDYIRGDNKDELYKLAVYKLDAAAVVETVNWRLGAEMYIEDMSMQLFFQSSLMIQNRTKGATITSDGGNQTDRVDSQPLKGWIYDFKNADMRVRHSGGVTGVQSNIIFNSANDNGLKIVRGAEYVGSEEPFDPKYFANSSKAVRISIQPGEIKRLGFSYKFSGKFVNVIKKLRVSRWDSVLHNLSGMTGKSQMICLEEQLRTPTDNKITIAYERELKIGSIFKENKRPAHIETFTASTEINNNV